MNQIPTIIIREPRLFSWEKLLWVLPFLTLGLLITFWPKSQNLIKDEVSLSDSAFIRTPKSLAQKNSSFSDYLAWENPDKNLENENDEDYIPLRLPTHQAESIAQSLEKSPSSLLDESEEESDETLASSSKLSSDALDSSKKKYEYDGSYGYDDSFFTSYPYYDDSFASSFYGNRERENNAPQIESTATEKSVTEENKRGPSGLMGSFSGPLSKGKKVAPSAASGTSGPQDNNSGAVSTQDKNASTQSTKDSSKSDAVITADDEGSKEENDETGTSIPPNQNAAGFDLDNLAIIHTTPESGIYDYEVVDFQPGTDESGKQLPKNRNKKELTRIISNGPEWDTQANLAMKDAFKVKEAQALAAKQMVSLGHNGKITIKLLPKNG
ncbi:MAG: hypothetical protein KBD63_07685, partial [Bacteriovoracaceae bacterium]|nr:hypothetical protein [Bacteriovoracaceae bacterium]